MFAIASNWYFWWKERESDFKRICVEATCTIKDCPLAKYLESMNKKNEAIMYFIKHIDSLFQFGISKFSDNIKLKIYYSLFLIQRMNKKFQELNEITACEKLQNK